MKHRQETAMPHRPSTDIPFIAEYADGSTHLFTIDKWTLRSGDYVAGIVAREKQTEGLLPNGEIKKVFRYDGSLH
jgi:hypothetical protein